jgi:hypothetical protein
VELRKKSRDAAVARRDALDALERSTARDARVPRGRGQGAETDRGVRAERAHVRVRARGAADVDGRRGEGPPRRAGGDAAKSDDGDGDGDGDGSGSEDEGEGDEDASAVGPLPTHLRV